MNERHEWMTLEEMRARRWKRLGEALGAALFTAVILAAGLIAITQSLAKRLLAMSLAAALALSAARADAQVCQLANSAGKKGTAVCVGTTIDGGHAILLTAGHCCEGTVRIAPEGRWVNAEVIRACNGGRPGTDLALLLCRDYRPRQTYALAERSPAVGTRVLASGFERGGAARTFEARVTQHGTGWTRIDAPAVGGISGGPLLVGRTVVGIITHNNEDADTGEAMNAETIGATLKAWRAGPQREQTSAWGVGMQCGPYGCPPPRCGPYGCPRPITPQQPYMQPADPFAAAPQSPVFPGWETLPETPDVRDNPITQPPADVVELRRRLAENEVATSELELAVKAIALKAGKPGQPGPQGPAGPAGRDGSDGRNGADGRDADPAALDDVKQRVGRLESTEIPVRILDPDGKTIDEKRYRLGEALEFRLVPRTPK